MPKQISTGLILACAALGAGAAGLGCSSEQSMEFTQVCSTSLLVAGNWAGKFKCENGACIAGSDWFSVEQDTADFTQVTVQITASTLPGDSGVVLQGDLCGNVFTWSATNPGNDETGTWTFTDPSHFTKTSTFDGGEYTCEGQGTKSPLPAPPDYFCPLP